MCRADCESLRLPKSEWELEVHKICTPQPDLRHCNGMCSCTDPFLHIPDKHSRTDQTQNIRPKDISSLDPVTIYPVWVLFYGIVAGFSCNCEFEE